MRAVIWILMVLLFDVSFSPAESIEDKAISLYNNGKKTEALKLLEGADSERALRLLIDYLTWENDVDRALRKIEIYEKKFGYEPEVAFRKAQLLAWSGKTVESRKLLRELLKEKTSFFPDVVELIGFTYLWEGRKKDAEFYLSWAYDLGKSEPELLKALAKLSDDTPTLSESKGKEKTTVITKVREPVKEVYETPIRSRSEPVYLEGEKRTGIRLDVTFRGDSYYFSDSSGSKLLMGTLGADIGIDRFALGVEGGGYSLNGEKGDIYGVYGKADFNPIKIEGGIKVYEGIRKTKFRKINPFLRVKLTKIGYTVFVGYERVLMGIYARSKKAYLEKIKAHKYSLTSSIDLFNKNLWSDISVLDIDDGNLIVIPQFSYDLYYFNYNRLSFTPFVAGYYLFSKEQKETYYSPEFHDEELLGINVRYDITDNVFISVKPSGGYSFKDKVYIYSVEGDIGLGYDRGNVSLFVNRSNSAGKFSTYNYNEIGLKGLIKW